MNVLNMLNTKYIIAEDQGQIFPYDNPDALGNAWFVSKLKELPDANSEIKALDSLSISSTAITTMSELGSQRYIVDSTATINLKEFKPNYLKYTSTNPNKGFAVFSEIYYSNGWNAYLDGNLVPHQRVNYVLRGMEIPSGNHTIEFKFEPQVVKTGSSIALASSALLGILVVLAIAYQIKQRKEPA
jgi:uncharacterized membrane protein YfhO